MRWTGGAATAIVLLVVAACGSQTPSPTGSAVASGAPGSPAPSTSPARSADAGAPIGVAGRIALLASDSSLSVLLPDGSRAVLDDTSDGMYGFPTWSPDGSHIAAVRSDGTQTSVVVFDSPDAGTDTTEPTVIFEKPNAAPFYLYWTPDSKKVSFLTNEADVLSLRLAPADGSAPVDGSGDGAVVRDGNPFYFDWLAADRLFTHIGTGSDAFVGEIGLDGDATGPGFKTPGDFRSAVVSSDQKSVAFVRGVTGGPGEVIVADRDGSNEHSMVVYGQTALMFDPAGGEVASIGSNDPQDLAGFPLGPLRLMDPASGDVRTLIDGYVVAFWWSPDGKTIAALRVQPSIVSATPSGEPSQEATTEVRLIFVDVASGTTLSQPTIAPSERFVSSFIAFFDQYALSHRIWSPDSSAILMSEAGDDGVTRATVRYPDGSDPVQLDGEMAFWSP
jgi:WD40 repeat protein